MFLNYLSWSVEGMGSLQLPHKVLEIRQLQHQQGSYRIHTGPTDMLSSAVQQLLLDTHCKGNFLRSIIVIFFYFL